jgi:hypothetical protein
MSKIFLKCQHPERQPSLFIGMPKLLADPELSLYGHFYAETATLGPIPTLYIEAVVFAQYFP